MRRWTLQICSSLFLLTLPFIGGCDQQQAHSAPVSDQLSDTSTNQPLPGTALNNTAPATPTAGDSADQGLANAPGKVISTPDNTPAPAPANTNPQLGDVVKLARAGVDSSILMAYVTNSPSAFNLSSDDVVYLNDLGVSQDVVNAMLQRDQYFNSMAGAGQTPPPQAVAPPVTELPPSDQNAPAPMVDQSAQAPTVETPPSETAVTPPLTPPEDVAADATQDTNNGSYTYFYDSLAPYGNWIDIDGYGPCWQPTVVVANPGWQPYCDAGNWVYTDCGWCWNSSYSWGWAPFHYGRWFHHSRWGWCWAPDTVWGPAWVSWRYNTGYCGWAPLPPAACYRPGFGFTFYGQSVGFNFAFGLSPSFFVFVPLGNFADRGVERFRVPHREITKIYNTTTVNNRIIRGNNNTLVNTGVPVDRVAAASHMTIQPIRIHGQNQEAGSAQLGRDGHTLSIYRPTLPLPKSGGNPRLAGEGVPPAKNFNLSTRMERTTATRSTGEQQPALNNHPGGTVPESHPVVSSPHGVTPHEPAPSKNPASPAWHATPGKVNNNGETPTAPHAPVVQPRTPAPAVPRTYYPPQQNVQPRQSIPQPQQRELMQPTPAPRQEYTPRQDVTPRQEAPPTHYEAPQPRYEAPRQEAPARSYEAPRQEAPAPAPSAPSHQESGQSGNGNGGNGGGGGGWGGGGGGGNGGGGGGRGH